jgi:ABC-type polysaccharide/polyol phosphate export permease
LFTLLAFLAALGPGLLPTALNVKYRHFRYVISFIVQFGLCISPRRYLRRIGDLNYLFWRWRSSKIYAFLSPRG